MTSLQGVSSWLLLIEIDGTQTVATSYNYEKTVTQTSEYEATKRELTELSTAIEIGYKNSASVSFKGIGSASAEFNSTFSRSMKSTVEATTRSKQTQSTTTTQKLTITAGPHEAVKVYQMVFTSDIYSTQSSVIHVGTAPPANVVYNFTATTTVSLDSSKAIILVLGSITPGSSNTREWRRIREVIAQHIADPLADQWNAIMNVFADTFPGSDNKVEWEEIRNTVQQIRKDNKPIALGVYKLAYRLAHIFPGRDNKVEWAEIRAICNTFMANC